MPFVETALFNESGVDSSGEMLVHFGGVTLRVTGTGNLDMTLKSQEAVNAEVLAPFAMSDPTAKQEFTPANIIEQRLLLRIETDQIDEIFKIQRILIWTKPVYTSLPG